MLGYVSGVYDILRAKDLEKLDMVIQKNKDKNNKYFAIAIYDELLCSNLGIDEPLKNIEDRLKIVEQLKGVDFTFPISTLDKKVIEKKAQEALNKYIEIKKNQKDEVNKKPYKIAYAPGTYDLFHAGHLENLLEASNKSDFLIAGVKSDELVQAHKGRKPIMNANERLEILKHFKFIDDVYKYDTRDPHVAASWIKSKYHQDVDAIFLGSDLKDDFQDITDIPIVFTDRDEKNMINRSTTGYIKKLSLRKNLSDKKYTGNIDISEKSKSHNTNKDNIYDRDDR